MNSGASLSLQLYALTLTSVQRTRQRVAIIAVCGPAIARRHTRRLAAASVDTIYRQFSPSPPTRSPPSAATWSPRHRRWWVGQRADRVGVRPLCGDEVGGQTRR